MVQAVDSETGTCVDMFVVFPEGEELSTAQAQAVYRPIAIPLTIDE